MPAELLDPMVADLSLKFEIGSVLLVELLLLLELLVAVARPVGSFITFWLGLGIGLRPSLGEMEMEPRLVCDSSAEDDDVTGNDDNDGNEEI